MSNRFLWFCQIDFLFITFVYFFLYLSHQRLSWSSTLHELDVSVLSFYEFCLVSLSSSLWLSLVVIGVLLKGYWLLLICFLFFFLCFFSVVLVHLRSVLGCSIVFKLKHICFYAFFFLQWIMVAIWKVGKDAFNR